MQNVKLNVTVKGEDNKPLKDVTVNITLPDGTNITGKTDANGNVTFTPDLSLGPHTLKVAVIGQYPYKNYYTTVTVEVKPINTNMTVSADNVIIGENTTITGILYDVDNKPIKNKIITIRIDKNYINEEVVVDSEGKYELSYETISVGEHTIKVIFTSNNKNYTSSINTTKFTVSPRTTNMTITNNATIKAGQNVTITGVLTDIFKEKITNTKVNITIEGYAKIENVEVDGNGRYLTTQTIDKIGTYKITVE